jgi:hypothetical protein
VSMGVREFVCVGMDVHVGVDIHACVYMYLHMCVRLCMCARAHDVESVHMYSVCMCLFVLCMYIHIRSECSVLV